MVIRKSQGLTVLHQYLNAIGPFSYNLNDKRQLCKSKSRARIKRALEKANTFFFPVTKNPSACVVTFAPCVSHRSGCKRHMPVEIISCSIEEGQGC